MVNKDVRERSTDEESPIEPFEHPVEVAIPLGYPGALAGVVE